MKRGSDGQDMQVVTGRSEHSVVAAASGLMFVGVVPSASGLLVHRSTGSGV